MNRALRNQHVKRCAFRKYGGGYGMGAPLVTIPANDGEFAVKVPVNQSFDDCAFPARFGQLEANLRPELAQVAMAGGSCEAGACMRGGARRRTYRKRANRRRATRKQGGGVYAINPAASVGGTGPNVGAVVSPVPCDARAGVHAGSSMLSPDVRAPTAFYSASPNQPIHAQTGGGVSGAPGSQLPVYNAESAGFTFRPSNMAGMALPDGVVAYNEVVPVAARGGARRSKRKTVKRKTVKRKVKGSRKH